MNYQARPVEYWEYRAEQGPLDYEHEEVRRIHIVEDLLDDFDPDICPICGPKDCVWHCDSSHCTCYYCNEVDAMRGEP
jgi:hypothetical protein